MRSLPILAAGLLLAGCGPKRPENAIVIAFDCLELQHVAGGYEDGEAYFGEIVVRGSADEGCATLSRIDFKLFADANENEVAEPKEVLHSGSETYGEYTTSARIYATSSPAARGTGTLRYEVSVTDSEGALFQSTGPCPP